jgi:hypothetical protein
MDELSKKNFRAIEVTLKCAVTERDGLRKELQSLSIQLLDLRGQLDALRAQMFALLGNRTVGRTSKEE